jgi:hypothetical protein
VRKVEGIVGKGGVNRGERWRESWGKVGGIVRKVEGIVGKDRRNRGERWRESRDRWREL